MIIPPQFYKKFLLLFLAGNCASVFSADTALDRASISASDTEASTIISPAVFTSHSLDFYSGQALFEKNWVPAPASTSASDGLGPFYNARSCNQCHPAGGRGNRDTSLVLHINDPVYGQQIQKYSVSGLAPEARVENSLVSAEGNAGLMAPEIKIHDLAYGPWQSNAYSARLAPALFGLGVLEQIPEAFLLARADENDSDGDGISGRVNFLLDQQGKKAIGRFGWKAGQISLDEQVSRALSLDLGLGNPRFPSPLGDCTDSQQACTGASRQISSAEGKLEAERVVIDLLLTYIRGLQLPASLDSATSTQVAERGSGLFRQVGCAACHVPVIETAMATIYPYSDLLLHDMGPGLGDELVEGSAMGQEWRTPPLWGLGRLKQEYLHDGRAASVHEAILWHEGEGAGARANYLELDRRERSDLNLFLNSL